MCTGLEIAAIVTAAAAVAGTSYTIAQGSPDLPKVPPPPAPAAAAAPPAVPPPPAALPPPPSEMEAGEGIARERRKRALRFGVESTLLVSPLGGGEGARPQAKSLLGGG